MPTHYNHRTDQSSLLLYYDFWNPASYRGAGPVYDLSGLGNHGTVAGTPTLSVDKRLVFNGIDAQITFPEVWVQPPWTSVVTFRQMASTNVVAEFQQTFFGHTSTSAGGWNRLFVDDDGLGGRRVRWLTRANTTAWTDFSAYIGSSGSSYVTPATQDAYWTNQFFCIITTIDSNKLFRIYRNGVSAYSTQRSTDNSNEFRSNKFGAYSTATSLNRSEIVNAAVYNRSFSQADVDHAMSLFRNRYGI